MCFLIQVNIRIYPYLYAKYTYFTYVKHFYTLSGIINHISYTSVPYRV